MVDWTRRQRILYLAVLAIAIVVGIFLRLPLSAFAEGSSLHAFGYIHPTARFSGIGFDEGLYREYVNALSKVGLSSYPDIVEKYIAIQSRLPASVLPPVRFLYYLCGLTPGIPSLEQKRSAALRNVAALFSILTLLVARFSPGV